MWAVEFSHKSTPIGFGSTTVASEQPGGQVAGPVTYCGSALLPPASELFNVQSLVPTFHVKNVQPEVVLQRAWQSKGLIEKEVGGRSLPVKKVSFSKQLAASGENEI